MLGRSVLGIVSKSLWVHELAFEDVGTDINVMKVLSFVSVNNNSSNTNIDTTIATSMINILHGCGITPVAKIIFSITICLENPVDVVPKYL